MTSLPFIVLLLIVVFLTVLFLSKDGIKTNMCNNSHNAYETTDFWDVFFFVHACIGSRDKFYAFVVDRKLFYTWVICNISYLQMTRVNLAVNIVFGWLSLFLLKTIGQGSPGTSIWRYTNTFCLKSKIKVHHRFLLLIKVYNIKDTTCLVY